MRDRTTSVKREIPEAGGDPGHPVSDVPEAGTNVLFDIWLVSRSATHLLDAALVSTGLTGDEFGIYSVLTSAEALTPSQLARWLSAPPTTVSSYVKRLEERGHVVREPNPDDRRSYRIRLTPEGRQVHQVTGQAFLPALEQVVAALGRDEPAVRAALGVLHTALDSLRDPALRTS
jgi:DNA-binding MarR family transcriptional regulator